MYGTKWILVSTISCQGRSRSQRVMLSAEATLNRHHGYTHDVRPLVGGGRASESQAAGRYPEEAVSARWLGMEESCCLTSRPTPRCPLG